MLRSLSWIAKPSIEIWEIWGWIKKTWIEIKTGRARIFRYEGSNGEWEFLAEVDVWES